MVRYWLHLLTSWMFCATLFAAAAPVLGTESAPPPEAPAEGGEAEPVAAEDGVEVPTEEQDGVQAVTEPQGDGRTLPVELKALLSELKTKNPKMEKIVRGLFFADGAWKKEFPGGLKEAQALKQQIEQTGGTEAVQSLQEELKGHKDLQDKWNRGDVSYVDDIASENPASFAKMVPRALDRLATGSPETYNHLMGQVIHATMRDANIPTQIYLAEQMLATGNVEEAKRIIGEIKGFVGSMEQLAKQAPKQPQEDPKAKELSAREEAIKNQERQAFNQSIAGEYNSYRDAAIGKAIDAQLNGKKVSDYARQTILKNAINEISEVLSKDGGYKAKFERLYNAGDKAEIVKFAKSRVDGLIEKSVQKVYRELYSEGTLGTKKPALKPNGVDTKPAEAGWVKLASAPRPEEIDNSKTSFDMKYHSKAVLKNGKKVQWD